MAENSDDFYEAMIDLFDSHLADKVNTSLEGTIVAYNAGRVDVRPDGSKSYSDGDSNAYGVIYDLPLHWLAGDGGKAGVKIPVKVGDKCTIVFKQHPQTEEGVDIPRRFSLADAYVLPGVAYPDELPGNDNVKMYYGQAFIEITPDGVININAPGGINMTGYVTSNNTVETKQGIYASGNGQSGNAMTVSGPVLSNSWIKTTDEITAGDIGLKSHHHTAQGSNADTTASKP